MDAVEREEEIKYLKNRHKYLIGQNNSYGPKVFVLIIGILVILLVNYFGTDRLTNSTPLTLLLSGVVIGSTISYLNYLLKIEDELKDIEIKLDVFGVYVADRSKIRALIKEEQKKVKRKRKSNGV